MEIHVTERHKAEGVRADCSYCPVALAAAEQHNILRDDITVTEDGQMWARDHRGKMRKYRLPQEARWWIDVFDRGTVDERAALTPIRFRAIRQ